MPLLAREPWRFLAADPIARTLLALAAVWLLALAIRPGLLGSLGVMRGISAIALLLAVAFLSLGLRRIGPRPERDFWRILRNAFGFWIATDVLLLAYADRAMPLPALLAVELTVALYYITLLYAVESRGHREAAERPVDRLALLAIVLFTLGLLAYFDLPGVFTGQGTSELSTEWLFAVIDLYLTLRLLSFAATTSSVRWQTLYQFLAAATLCSTLGDVVGLVWTRAEGNFFYTLTALLVALAARLRHHRFPTPEPTTMPPRLKSESGWLTIVYVLVFPLVHLLLYQMGLLEPVARAPRDQIVLLWIVLLGGLAVVQSRLSAIRRKQLEAESEAFVHQLRARSDELERFAYTVSHDLKSPLVTIEGFLGFLGRNLEAGKLDRAHSDLERIRAASRHMGQFLDDLLALSRAGQVVGEVEEIPLDAVAREAVEMVGGQLAEKGVVVEIEPGLPVVRGDRTRLLQVFQNLVDNASKFMGSQVSPRIVIASRRDGDRVVCCVCDNGLGIAPEQQRQVFGIFNRLDHETGGSGIGLALVQRIVETLGGKIWIESKGLGHGSRFCFSLPTADS